MDLFNLKNLIDKMENTLQKDKRFENEMEYRQNIKKMALKKSSLKNILNFTDPIPIHFLPQNNKNKKVKKLRKYVVYLVKKIHEYKNKKNNKKKNKIIQKDCSDENDTDLDEILELSNQVRSLSEKLI
jgi:hypothetical protein